MAKTRRSQTPRLKYAVERAAAVLKIYFRDHRQSTLKQQVRRGKLTPVEAYELLREIARDPKTDLDRGELLEATLRYEMGVTRRAGRPLTVAVIDIDDFKQINSELTHIGGDRVLKAVATIIQRATRVSDAILPAESHVVRWGGEEFIIILTGTMGSDATLVLNRIRRAIGRKLRARRPNGRLVTVSIGAASWDGKKRRTWKSLIGTADRNLFAAKRHGKNRVIGPTST